MNCIYCGAELTVRNKSSEHVIPQWLIEHLSAKNVPVDIAPITAKGERLSVRNSVPSKVTHKICNTCNNGWLSDIDNSCKELIMELARGDQRKPLEGLVVDLEKLRTFIYKIFLNFIATSHFKTDKEIFFKAFYQSRKAPQDIALFYTKVLSTSSVQLAHSDTWKRGTNIKLNAAWLNGAASGLRFKFYIQIGLSAYVLVCSGNQYGSVTYDPSLLLPLIDNENVLSEKASLDPPPNPIEDCLSNRLLWSMRFVEAN